MNDAENEDRALHPRDWRILEMREEEKKTYRQIGEELGFGAQRAREIYKRVEDRKNSPYLGLKGRAQSILSYNGIETREDARKAYNPETGEFMVRSRRGLGKATLKGVA